MTSLEINTSPQYGPLTLVDSMTEAMSQRARELSGQYDRDPAALLAEALGAVGMTMMDLSMRQLGELGDREAEIEEKYQINEFDEQIKTEEE